MNVPECNRLYMTLGNIQPLYITLNMNLTNYNLTGATVWFTVKRFISDADSSAIMVQKKSPASLSIVDPVSGMIKINITSSDSANFNNNWYNSYMWDIQVLDNLGDIITTTYGSLGVYPGITNTKS